MEKEKILNLPFVPGVLGVWFEEMFDLKCGGFYLSPGLCKLQCERCSTASIRSRQGGMEQDAFIQLLKTYELAEVELLVIRGGDPVHVVGQITPALTLMKEQSRVRLHVSGIRPQVLLKLRGEVSGFKLDLKIPAGGTLTVEQRAVCGKVLGGEQFVDPYRVALNESIGVVDGMELSFFSSTSFGDLTPDLQGMLVDSVKGRKSALIVGEKKLN